MADEGGGLPDSPGGDTTPGWYPVGPNANHQAYWDGGTWTARRRWAGAGWTETPLDPGDVRPRTAPVSPPTTVGRSARPAATFSSGRWPRSWVIGVVAVVVVAAVALGVALSAGGKGTTPGASLPVDTIPLPTSGAAFPSGETAYVSSGANGLYPLDLATNTLGSPFNVPDAGALAIAPGDRTAIVSSLNYFVAPVDVATGTVGANIGPFLTTPTEAEISGPAFALFWPFGFTQSPSVTFAIAITPNGRTAYVTTGTGGTVIPIDISAHITGAPIAIPHNAAGIAAGIAITPNGRTAYVTTGGSGTVVPIDLATGTVGRPIMVTGAANASVDSIAITPDGRTAYVTTEDEATVIPIDLVTGRAGSPIALGVTPTLIPGGDESGAFDVVMAPDGRTAYVTTGNTIVPIDVASDTAGAPITIGYRGTGSARTIAITPDGRTAYVTGQSGVVVVELGTGAVGLSIHIPTGADYIATPP